MLTLNRLKVCPEREEAAVRIRLARCLKGANAPACEKARLYNFDLYGSNNVRMSLSGLWKRPLALIFLLRSARTLSLWSWQMKLCRTFLLFSSNQKRNGPSPDWRLKKPPACDVWFICSVQLWMLVHSRRQLQNCYWLTELLQNKTAKGRTNSALQPRPKCLLEKCRPWFACSLAEQGPIVAGRIMHLCWTEHKSEVWIKVFNPDMSLSDDQSLDCFVKLSRSLLLEREYFLLGLVLWEKTDSF